MTDKKPDCSPLPAQRVKPYVDTCRYGHSLDDAIYQRVDDGVARKCRTCHNKRELTRYHKGRQA